MDLKNRYCICPFCDKTIDEVKSVLLSFFHSLFCHIHKILQRKVEIL